MEIAMLIRRRMEKLGLEQRDLARAARVTESYISQLLTRKKAPPAPDRTDLYDRMGKALKLPHGELARLAGVQRREALKRTLEDAPAPLYKEVRELILRKCHPGRRKHVRPILERQPFGELERLVTQKLLDVVKELTRDELGNEPWIRLAARLGRRRPGQMQVLVREFLDTDIINLSAEQCVAFLDPVIESWDIDLATFSVDIVLSRRVAREPRKRFGFVELAPGPPPVEEAGFREFLEDPSLAGDADGDEIAHLDRLRFAGKRPTALYYYRELQSLRDPLHFSPRAPGRTAASRPRRPATGPGG
ncbi:MAG: helix-turn-helix domain-containing protein [Candidatus Polarisedimenticolia bacterium]